MGKILLVEPRKILRRAISLSLFPENEVQVVEQIPDSKSESLEGYDLVILDGPELRRQSWWSPELDRKIQSAKVPVLWLEDDDAGETAGGERQKALKKPLEKAALQSAVASFLSPSGPEKERGRRSTSPQEKARETGTVEAKEAPASAPEEVPQFIDLVDAVEEEASPSQPKQSARKRK